jgi:hypothetical protein
MLDVAVGVHDLLWIYDEIILRDVVLGFYTPVTKRV